MKVFKYPEFDKSYSSNYVLEKEIPIFQNMCGTILTTLKTQDQKSLAVYGKR